KLLIRWREPRSSTEYAYITGDLALQSPGIMSADFDYTRNTGGRDCRSEKREVNVELGVMNGCEMNNFKIQVPIHNS
ncbi:MAG: hypothetical protein ABIR18_03625, partial [Chitinophagaceae bacterium]